MIYRRINFIFSGIICHNFIRLCNCLFSSGENYSFSITQTIMVVVNKIFSFLWMWNLYMSYWRWRRDVNISFFDVVIPLLFKFISFSLNTVLVWAWSDRFFIGFSKYAVHWQRKQVSFMLISLYFNLRAMHRQEIIFLWHQFKLFSLFGFRSKYLP